MDALCLFAGVKFLQDNLQKMEEDDAAHMPIGFEIVFPAMLEDAKHWDWIYHTMLQFCNELQLNERRRCRSKSVY